MNIKEVQQRLWTQSKSHREGGPKVRNVFDLLHHPAWLMTAAHRVLGRSRYKAAGIDKMTVNIFNENFEANLESLRREIKSGNYRPRPNRRVEIPKANGKMRCLGIPCLRDKIVQEAIRMVLEPIYEPMFSDTSYGFRPNRNTAQAVYECKHLIESGLTVVIEGDISQCFDRIAHPAILRELRHKIVDSKFIHLVEKFLKVGAKVGRIFERSTTGTPQGGIISPILANIVLHVLDDFLTARNVRFVRYADDFCIFLQEENREQAPTLKEEIAVLLETSCGLELSTEKTHITEADAGFHFVGFRLQRQTDLDGSTAVRTSISRKTIDKFRDKMESAIKNHSELNADRRMLYVNSIIRGWAESVRITVGSRSPLSSNTMVTDCWRQTRSRGNGSRRII